MNNQFLDIDLFETLTDQLSSAASTSGGRNNLAKWIQENTSDPLSPHKPWSFKEHEFQIDIVNSLSPRTYVRKASQLGVSEIMVRIAMALLAKLPGRHAIYTLPDANFAKKFAPSRFDPVIQNSRKLKLLIDKELNNNEIKKFASSYLYIAGAQKESQSISVPASIMMHDEIGYSNQEVLGTYASRLGHLKQGEEIVYGFSTPLLPNSDIDQLFQKGTKETYMCYHDACSTWVVVDPLLHIRVPGLSTSFELFAREDLRNANVHPEQAYVECAHCKRPISQDNLADPLKRAWVPEHPDRYSRSFDANFLVIPKIKTIEKILRDRDNYRSQGKWLNFAVGVPADSSDSRITSEAIDRCFQVAPISPEQAKIAPPLNIVMGMDVGKTGHLIVARKTSSALEIVHLEMPKQDSDNYLATRFAALYQTYFARQGVIDAGPEFTVVTKAQTITPYNHVHGAYFVRGNSKSDLEFYEKKEDRGTVMIQRTKGFDLFVEEFNAGKVLFPRNSPHEALIREHLRNLSRVTDFDAQGSETAKWVSTGPDHILFATFYAYVAAEMISNDPSAIILPASSNFAGKVRMKS